MKPSGPIIIELGDLDAAHAAYGYEGRAGQAVRKLKFNRSTSLAPFMACEIARIASGLTYDFVCPVPIHLLRWCSRGFNQAELLCAEFPRSERQDLLRRIRFTRPQVGLSAQDRRTNLVGAFQSQLNLAGKHVLVIDDVVTTGGTARECAKVLKSAGAARVELVVFASQN
jgi:ComF family protein